MIEAGCELMHERGYTAVGVSDVCSTAGVKKGSFYHFFPSKVDLALDIIERQALEMESALEEMVSGDKPPLERLTGYADKLSHMQAEQQESCGKVLGCPIGNLALEISTQQPKLSERLRRVFDHTMHSFAEVVREAIERGDLPTQDPRRAGRSILALLEGHIMLAKINNDAGMLQGAGKEILAFLGRQTPAED